jgi:hypothetical protein
LYTANDNVSYLYLYGLTCPVAAYVAGMQAKMELKYLHKWTCPIADYVAGTDAKIN